MVRSIKRTWERQRSKLSQFSSDTVSMAPSEVPSDIFRHKIIKYGNPMQAAWGIFAEYCSNSSIHGIRYLGQRGRPRLERIFWIFVFLSSIYLCVQLIMSVWKKWDSTPVIVSFAEKSTPVWHIPFPSVILCPQAKALQSEFNYTKAYNILRKHAKNNIITKKPNEMTDEDFERVQVMEHLCTPEHKKFIDIRTTNNIDMIAIMEDLSLPFNTSAPFCKWKNNIRQCRQWFRKVLTNDGICYSFNGLDDTELAKYEMPLNRNDDNQEGSIKQSHWMLQNGYDEDAGSDVFPERVYAQGLRSGMFVALVGLNNELDVLCQGPIQGFKVFLQSPDESPQAVKHYLTVPFNQEVIITVIPSMITTSHSLSHYPPQRRQCYFNNEKFLRFYKVYTQNNCNYECLVNYTITQCGCVKFSMPRPEGMRFCTVSDISCYSKAEDNILLSEFNEGVKGSKHNYRGITTCNCLPACTSLTYDIEISQANLDVKRLFQSHNTNFNESDPDQDEHFKLSKLSIFFKKKQFLTMRRSELFGSTDFIAYCGGLLGLFMGFSTLSLMELIYFCTMRLISNIKMRKEQARKNRKITESCDIGTLSPTENVLEPGYY